jgi:hypothetical protein
MPFGFPLPSPAAGSGNVAQKYFSDFDQMMAPALEAQKRAAALRYQSTVDMTEQAIQQTQAMQNPIPQMAVPEVNPLMAAAAGFFGHMAGPQAFGSAENMLSNQVAQAQNAQQFNAESAGKFALAKQGSTEELHMQLLKAKRDAAAESGNLDETFQMNKALYALERQKKKEDLQAAADAQQATEKTKQSGRLALIAARGAQSRLTATTVAKYRKEAEARGTTPAQRARLAMANAQVAELRAHIDDMRSARDIAGDPLYTDDEIAAREESVMGQVKDIYQAAITDFESEKDSGKLGKDVTPAPSTAPPAGSDRVRAAADRLRGTPLFQQ